MTFESPKRILKFLLKPYIIIILILAPITFWIYIEDLYPRAPSTTYEIPRKKPIITNTKKDTQTQDTLTKAIDSELAKLKGDYAIIIKDLTHKVEYTKNSNTEMTSASIYKLAVMYKIYEMVEEGKIGKQTELSPGFTVEEALDLMITVSHNDSAVALAEKAGWENTQNSLEAAGIIGFKLSQETPTVTAKAVSDLLEQIYFNKAVSAEASREMKTLLLAQEINDRIPKYLPKDVKVAHKTGELDTIRHDAGIVFGKKSDYIFALMSRTSTPGVAAEDLAQLAKVAYEALE